jgi:hypothetical protein
MRHDAERLRSEFAFAMLMRKEQLAIRQQFMIA